MKFGEKEGILTNRNAVLKDFYPIISLMSLFFFIIISLYTGATLTIQVLNFTNLLPNQTITAMIDANITFNATFDSDSDGDNVTLFFYNNTGTNFVTSVNFTNYANGTLGSYLFNSSNYTKRDTIVIQAYAWNGTVNSSFVNISSFINGTNNNYVCVSNESCEFQWLQEALDFENNTDHQIYLLENNTNYTLNVTSSYIFNRSTLNMINLTNLFNVMIDCNQSYLNNSKLDGGIMTVFTDANDHIGITSPNVTIISITNTTNLTIRNCKFIGNTEEGLNSTGAIIARYNYKMNITNNTFIGTRGSIALEQSNFTYISFNNFSNVQTVLYSYNSTENTMVEGNTVFNVNATNYGHLFWLKEYESNLTARDNYLSNITSPSIFVTRSKTDTKTNKFINNTIFNYFGVDDNSGVFLLYISAELSNNTVVNSKSIATHHDPHDTTSTGVISLIGNNFTNITNYVLTNINKNVPFTNYSIKNNYFLANNATLDRCLDFEPQSANTNSRNVEIINNTFYQCTNLIREYGFVNVVNNTFNETGNISNIQTGYPISLYGISLFPDKSTSSNITGNKFYNKNTTISAINLSSIGNTVSWYNRFYAGGINNESNITGCYNSIGNFYDYRLSYSKMASGECGLVNITAVNYVSPILFNWTNQSSYVNLLNYTLEYTLGGGARTAIATVNSTNYTWTLSSDGSYVLYVIAYDGYANGTHRNFTFNYFNGNFTFVPPVNNNYVCINPVCEYQNITSALIGENNTGSQVQILENDTIQSINYANSYFNISTINISSNSTLDCNNSIIDGYGRGYGIFLSSYNVFTLKNCIIKNYSIGIGPINIGNLSIINNTFNETGNRTTGYFVTYSPLTHAGRNFDCVRYAGGAGAELNTQVIKDNSLLSQVVNGTANFTKLWLLTDDATPAFSCGNNANVTVYVDNNYPLDCAGVVGANGGTCQLAIENQIVLQEQGANNNYLFNSSVLNATLTVIGTNSTPAMQYNGYFFQTGFPINLQGAYNINITGNKFYHTNLSSKPINIFPTSYNITLWYNSFYTSGINGTLDNATGCYSSKGNFYDYRIPYSSMLPGECGLINITAPSSQSSANPITITWTAQSSYGTITYILDYILNNVRTTIGTTTSTSYSWSVPSNGNFTINVIPQGSNGTNRNSTVLIDIPEQTETPSSMPSGGGEAGDVPPIVGILLEKAEGFIINITKINLTIKTNEIKNYSLEVTNPLQNDLIIKVIPDKNLAGITRISEDYFVLEPGDTKNIIFSFNSNNEGAYNGIIKLVSDNYQRIIEVNIIAKASQIEEIKPPVTDKTTLLDRIRSFLIWIGNIITSLVNWFKALF